MDYEKMIWDIYQQEMSNRSNDDYIVNRPQMKKFAKVYKFFKDYADNNGGRIEPMHLIPKQEHQGMTAYFTLFAPFGQELTDFQEVMQYISAISIDSLTNGDVCISLNIPDVFKHK